MLEICWKGGYHSESDIENDNTTNHVSKGRQDARRKAVRHLEKILEEETQPDEDIF